MNARPDYSRMPGPGDLPGDNTNPNSPDYVAPAFDETEAMWSVAKSMDPDDVAEILGDLADASGWLDCILRNIELARGARSRLEMLAHHARQMSAKRDREYRVLNGADR